MAFSLLFRNPIKSAASEGLKYADRRTAQTQAQNNPNQMLVGKNAADLRLQNLRKQNQAKRPPGYQINAPLSVGKPYSELAGGTPNAPISPVRAAYTASLGAKPAAPTPPPAAPYGGTPAATDPAMVGGADRAAQRAAPPAPVAPATPEAAPAAPAAPAPDTTLKDAYDAYIASLAPSSASQDARKRYLDFVQSRDLGLQEIADKPIPMRFVTGQQESVARLAGIEEQRRLGEIGLAQEADTAAQAQAQARLDYAKSLAAAQAPATPVEVGGNLVDPRTGRVIYRGATGAEKPLSVSEGQTVIDPSTGRVIFRSEKQEAPKYERVGDTLLRINSDGSVEQVFTDSSGKSSTKPLTEAQAKNAGFALRMQNASSLVDRFGGAAAGGSGAFQSLLPGGALTNWLRTPEYQQLDQAQRDFVNAVLRRESGAAISPSEFQNAKLQYFPIAGDTPQVIAQKKANRESAIRGVQLGAGATDEVLTAPDGSEYMKGEDGLYYPKADGGAGAAEVVSINIGNKAIKVAPTIASKLSAAARDFKAATGRELQINQHFRTREEQARLYKELSAKGARVAPPGKSWHEKGLAIDVTNWREAEPYLRKYGLRNDLADDRGHFSFNETA